MIGYLVCVSARVPSNFHLPVYIITYAMYGLCVHQLSKPLYLILYDDSKDFQAHAILQLSSNYFELNFCSVHSAVERKRDRESHFACFTTYTYTHTLPMQSDDVTILHYTWVSAWCSMHTHSNYTIFGMYRQRPSMWICGKTTIWNSSFVCTDLQSTQYYNTLQRVVAA